MSSDAHSFYYGGKFLSKVIDSVRPVVETIIDEHGDMLVDMEYVKEKGQNYLRIYVDRQPNGIDIDEIAALSELVSKSWMLLIPIHFQIPMFWNYHLQGQNDQSKQKLIGKKL